MEMIFVPYQEANFFTGRWQDVLFYEWDYENRILSL
jgi:thiamine phosphate synthase YjbQ (UPF0047 family)